VESWSDEQLGRFRRDGFVVVEEGFVDADAVEERLARDPSVGQPHLHHHVMQ